VGLGPLWASRVAIRWYRCTGDGARNIGIATRDAHKGLRGVGFYLAPILLAVILSAAKNDSQESF